MDSQSSSCLENQWKKPHVVYSWVFSEFSFFQFIRGFVLSWNEQCWTLKVERKTQSCTKSIEHCLINYSYFRGNLRVIAMIFIEIPSTWFQSVVLFRWIHHQHVLKLSRHLKKLLFTLLNSVLSHWKRFTSLRHNDVYVWAQISIWK